MTTEIDIHDELEILCLLNSWECPARRRLKDHFGMEISTECPARKLLKQKYEDWKLHKDNDKNNRY